MARGLLAGLVFGVLIAALIWGVTALRLEHARTQIVIKDVPPVVSLTFGPETGELSAGGVPRASKPVPKSAPAMDTAPGVVLSFVAKLASPLATALDRDALAPPLWGLVLPDPFGSSPLDTLPDPLDMFNEAAGPTQPFWDEATPLFDPSHGPLVSEPGAVAPRPSDSIALQAPVTRPDPPVVAVSGPETTVVGDARPDRPPPPKPLRAPPAPEAWPVEQDTAVRHRDLLRFSDVPSIEGLLGGRPAEGAVPVGPEGPVMAIVLHEETDPQTPPNWFGGLLPEGPDTDVALAVQDLAVIPAGVDRGALSALAWAIGQQQLAGPMVLMAPWPSGGVLEDLGDLMRASGLGLVVDPAVFAQISSLTEQGQRKQSQSVAIDSLAPLYTTGAVQTRLMRAASHARRDGAVIVLMPNTPETRDAVRAWRAAPTDVSLVTVSQALRRITARP